MCESISLQCDGISGSSKGQEPICSELHMYSRCGGLVGALILCTCVRVWSQNFACDKIPTYIQ